MAAPRRRKGVDYCEQCGSESLFSGWFGPDDYATEGDAPDDRYTTFCNDCGAEQAAKPPRPRKPRPS